MVSGMHRAPEEVVRAVLFKAVKCGPPTYLVGDIFGFKKISDGFAYVLIYFI